MADADMAAFLEALNENVAEESNASNTNPTPVVSTEPIRRAEEDDDDYDPSALVTPNLPVSAEKNTSTTTGQQNGGVKKQARVKGGFVIEDDDEDDGDVHNSSTNGLLNGGIAASSDLRRSLTGTPSNANVSLQKTEDSTQDNTTGASLNAPSVPSDSRAISSTPHPPVQSPSLATASDVQRTASISLPKVRLPQDRVGQLEDRIAEDPRGDVDAWLELINEHRIKNRLDDARAVYKRLFALFPSATSQWVAYAKMELDNEDFYRLEQIFSQALPSNPNVQLWSQYLNYILRRNNLTTDTTGEARQTISQAYDFVLQNLGIDKDSGLIWKDYVNFLKAGPGTAGGPNWQDQQKMDSLRRAYRQAVCIPTQSTQELWTDYHKFETGLNKLTASKFMQDRTASFLTAKEAYIQLSNITRNLNRDVLPRLPPSRGFEGDVEYDEQIDIWKEWIKWELQDPVVLKDEDSAGYFKRIVYVYKQATMTKPFEPEFWYEAAEFCFNNNMETEGTTFLSQGITSNPESCLLAFKRADRIESTTVHEDGEEALKSRGAAVREPYDKVIDALYALLKTTLDRQEKSIERIDESFAQRMPQSAVDKDDNDDEREEARKLLEAERDKQIKAIKTGCQIQVDLIRRTLSFAWIALMRAMRRVQGKGFVDASAPVGGSRQIFGQARKRGSITSDVYVASALMEHHCYKDPSAAKIFSRGMTLFPLDEMFALEYLKHLININDGTNARAVFETIVNKLTSKPDLVHRSKLLFYFFHTYESKYGELSQMAKLEKRMAILFPSDPQLNRFAHRFETGPPGQFDPTRVRPIISMATQARPKQIHPSIERAQHARSHSVSTQGRSTPQLPSGAGQPFSPRVAQASPRPAAASLGNLDVPHRFSPKRPFPADFDDSLRPQKVSRGESPLKGAAGRRLDAAKRRLEHHGQVTAVQPAALPRDVNFFLSILPDAKFCDSLRGRMNAGAVMAVLRAVNLGGQGAVGGVGMVRGGSGSGYGSTPGQQPMYGYPQR